MFASLKNKLRNFLLANPSKANYKFVLKAHQGLFDRSRSARLLETKCFTEILQPVLLEVPKARKALIVAPHADDDIFGTGGVLLKLKEKAAEIETVYITDAGKDEAAREAIRCEALEICQELGVVPHFLNGKVKSIPNKNKESEKLSEILSRFQPDVIFTTFLLDDHPDHQNANQVLSAALEKTGLTSEIWSYQIYTTVLPNVVVDITDQMDRKEELMRKWKSVSGNRDWAHYIRGMNAMNCRFIPGREKIYAEGFFVVPTKEYLALCRQYFAVRD